MPQSFTAARINMVDCQINTMGVVNDAILEAFRTIPRESYVPKEKQCIAYCDEDLPLGSGRCLMEPVTHARLLQAAEPSQSDNVLDVGCATGYSSAVLAKICSRVVALETDPALLALAQQEWAKASFKNILPHQGPFGEGYATGAPYTLIIINGSVCDVPSALIEQLGPGGRLLAVVRKPTDKIGRAVQWLKTSSGHPSERVLFDAAVPYLPGHGPGPEFVF